MDKQAREAREMVKSLSFKEKVKHFWDYYKWHTIGTIFVLMLAVVTIYQATTAEKYDLEIAYYGKIDITEEQKNELCEYLSLHIEDINGDGEKKVNIIPIVADMESMGEFEMAVSQKLTADLAAGTHSAYIFDEWFCNYCGPDTDYGATENAVDLRETEVGREVLALNDEPLYWCTKTLYESEKDNNDKIAVYNNARLAEAAIKKQ